MKYYESLNDAFCDLKRKGYDNDFAIPTFGLYCGDLDLRLDPEDFHVDEIDEVEDNAIPRNDIMIYAISSSVGVKGTLIVDLKNAPGE